MDILKTAPVIDFKGRKRGIKVLICCPVCEKRRWVRVDATRVNSFTGMCKKCHNKFTSNRGEKHPRWKGGAINCGYKEVKLQPEDPFYIMARANGYIREHRLVMAKSLGRPLECTEVVHHKNGIRDDNRIENLELFVSQLEHLPSMAESAGIKRIKNENIKLKNIINTLQKIVLLTQDKAIKPILEGRKKKLPEGKAWKKKN